jgi:hypothetical protein
MSNKSSISKAKSYKDIGEFWDGHDASEFGEQIDAEFQVDLNSQVRYYPIDNQFTKTLKRLANQRGVSEVTLINLWIQEKLIQMDKDKNTKKANQ